MKDLALLILRAGLSGLMLPHGIKKAMKVFSGNFDFADPIGLGETTSVILTTFAEAICPVLIILGFKTRWAAIPVAFTMFVAAFIVHWDDPWAKKELPLVYLIGFVTLSLFGGGKYSIDKK